MGRTAFDTLSFDTPDGYSGNTLLRQRVCGDIHFFERLCFGLLRTEIVIRSALPERSTELKPKSADRRVEGSILQQPAFDTLCCSGSDPRKDLLFCAFSFLGFYKPLSSFEATLPEREAVEGSIDGGTAFDTPNGCSGSGCAEFFAFMEVAF